MPILSKGTDFTATEQVTSTKLDNLVDGADFTDTSGNAVNSASTTGTCVSGGGIEVTSGGQLQVKDADIDLVKFSTNLKNSIHPIGIILETTQESTAADFQTKIGFGTWAAYGTGRVTVAIDASQTEFDGIGETSGSKTHTLGTTEIPPHNHTFTRPATRSNSENDNNSAQSGAYETQTSGNGNVGENGNGTGSSSPHNNLQPYIVVYRYRRTA